MVEESTLWLHPIYVLRLSSWGGARYPHSVFIPSAPHISQFSYGIAADPTTETLTARQPGIFRQEGDKCWISVHSRRYVAEKGDRVIGIVAGSAGDFYKLDIGTPENAMISCNLARRLLSCNSELLKILGKEYKFEITVGLNGRVWLKGSLCRDVSGIPEDKDAWNAYWQLRDLDSRGTVFPRIRYYAHKAFDAPATWFRESIVEPMNNRNRLPYYQRKLSRVPEIDECGVNDKACFFEANEQFRLDKMVDGFILQTLRGRVDRCINYNESSNLQACAKVIEDLEENELNFFIKYGELGSEADVRDAYMKQKHRLIWERRHPEIMEERKKALKEHKEKLEKGEFDFSFWKKNRFWQDKKNYEPPYEFYLSKSTLEGDKPLSKDWQYYKKVC
ncbi:unnamed protein product [Nippostrongylus brasiliensis]|uniref:NADH dehydrogenase [ubiquinone] 1 beta subcomplex subunit 10 n=1 Tax=Nippostrongylus brasiliensis TaxID=27835 RepID=A0A0N4YC27_NIPBR|nr:unnamed protein product [Nippostrongylus brasiliensis]